MADTKLSALSVASGLTTGDLFYIAAGGTTSQSVEYSVLVGALGTTLATTNLSRLLLGTASPADGERLTVVGFAETVGDADSTAGVINYGSGGYTNGGASGPLTIRVWAYYDAPGGRVFSTNYAEGTVTTNNSNDAYNVDWSWNAPGAGTTPTGYRVLRNIYDNSGFGTAQDVMGTSFNDSNSGWSGSTIVTPTTQNDPAAYLTGALSLGGAPITAGLSLPAGNLWPGGAPLKVQTATALLTTLEAGAVEYDGTYLYVTPASLTRYRVLVTDNYSGGTVLPPNGQFAMWTGGAHVRPGSITAGTGITATFNTSAITIAAAATNHAVTSNVTTTSSTMADVTGLSFAIAANEQWTAEFHLLASGSTGGMKFQLTGPASPNTVAVFTQGDTTAVSVLSSDNQTAFGSATQAYVANTVAYTGVVTIKVFVLNGANAGTVKLQFAATTNTQSNTITAGSYMVARRNS